MATTQIFLIRKVSGSIPAFFGWPYLRLALYRSGDEFALTTEHRLGTEQEYIDAAYEHLSCLAAGRGADRRRRSCLVLRLFRWKGGLSRWHPRHPTKDEEILTCPAMLSSASASWL
jgi:hypothetical protein